MKNQQKTAYSYVRFSTPRQQHGDSLRRQTEATESYCAANGLTLDRTLNLKDLGVSAYHGKNAAAGKLGKFITAVESGKVQPGATLVVESIDRLSRAEVLTALELFTRIINLEIEIVTLIDGKKYTKASVNGNPMDLMFSIMVMSRANEESAVKSHRSRANWTAARTKARENGKCKPGNCPFWTTPNATRTAYDVIPAKMSIARRIIDAAIAGYGTYSIAKTLNADGIANPTGKTLWSAHAVEHLLKSKTLIGQYQPRDITGKPIGEAVKAYYPAVCSEAEFYRIAASRKAPAAIAKGRTGTGVSNLFTGLLTHQPTNSSMRILVSRGKRLIPSAAHAGKVTWDSFGYAAFEDAFLRFVSEIEINTAPRSSKVAAIETELGMVSETLARLQNELNQNGNVDAFIIAAKNWTSRKEALTNDLENERAKNATPAVSTADISAMYAAMSKMPEDQRTAARLQLRSAIAAVVKQIDMAYETVRCVTIAAVRVTLANQTSRFFVIRYASRGADARKCQNGGPVTQIAGTSAIGHADFIPADLMATVRAMHTELADHKTVTPAEFGLALNAVWDAPPASKANAA